MHARQELIVRDDLRQHVITPYASSQLSAAMPSEQAEPSLLAAILRHWWLVLLGMMVGGGAATLYLKKATPLYTSETKIYCEPTGPKVLSETLGSAQRSNYLYTQAELIKSTPILQTVAEMPAIKQLPTFSYYNVAPLRYIYEELTAEVGRKDDLIDISITSPYPKDACLIVDSVVEAYQKFQTVERKSSTDTVLDALRKNKTQADDELKSLDNDVYDFQQKNPTLNFDSVFNAELATLSQTYTSAQLASIEARAKYGPGNEILQRAQRREEELYAQYQDKLHQVMKLSLTNVDYSQLVSKQATKREFAKRLDDRIKELEINKDAEQIINQVSVLEPGGVADQPSFPRTWRTLVAAIVGGGLLGAGLALLRDRMDNRMRSVEEIQTVIGLPILGVVPAMGSRRTAVARAMAVHLDPRSVVAEAYRTVRTAIYFSNGATQVKTILVTSPEPGDGKTTSASNLAIAMAQTGRSVLLLDADFRKPTQHKNLDVKDAIGLSSVIIGRETLDAAIQHTGVEGLDILPCGPIPANPSEILNSREFAGLIDSLSIRYDHIIFDSPPVNPVTDARILAAVCDSTVLVLRADKSTRRSGEHARNALLAVGARLMGAIVNDASRRKGYEVYGGGYYGVNEPSIRPTPSYSSNSARQSPLQAVGS